jgi:hypothetical protein
VYFPRGELALELRARDDCLDQLITITDDDRVLARTFRLLDRIAVLRAAGEAEHPGRARMDIAPNGHSWHA